MSDLTDAGFSRVLLKSQDLAVTRLVQSRGGGNFSVPGSGKTTMTYAVYAALRHAGHIDCMLVIAPLSAYEAWSEEAHDCFTIDARPAVEIAPSAPRRSADVVVMNYERAANGGVRAAIDGWRQGRRILVVFDEAHRAKRGANGQHGQGALDLASMATCRLVLTGTPMPNSPDDLAAALELAWPGHGQRLANPRTVGGSKAWVRITKDDLGLDAANIQVVPVRLDDHHHRVYDLLTKRVSDAGIEAHPTIASKAIARLIACASNPALLTEEKRLDWPELMKPIDDDHELLDAIGAATRPSKLLAAASIAYEHADRGEKLLIWTNFIGNIQELARILKPLNPAVVTGSVPRNDPSAPTDRDRELRKFREDSECSVLIATPQTLGEGVSLHRICQSQVHVDRTYNAGLYLQALDRTHRIGMPEGTTAQVKVLVATGTIDEDVQNALGHKFAQMDAALRDPTLRALSTIGITNGDMSVVDVRRILGHLT